MAEPQWSTTLYPREVKHRVTMYPRPSKQVQRPRLSLPKVKW